MGQLNREHKCRSIASQFIQRTYEMLSKKNLIFSDWFMFPEWLVSPPVTRETRVQFPDGESFVSDFHVPDVIDEFFKN